MIIELCWYSRHRREEKEFEKFKEEIRDQMLEVNQRLELVIEHPKEEK
jgi:hypothetical protein